MFNPETVAYLGDFQSIRVQCRMYVGVVVIMLAGILQQRAQFSQPQAQTVFPSKSISLLQTDLTLKLGTDPGALARIVARAKAAKLAGTSAPQPSAPKTKAKKPSPQPRRTKKAAAVAPAASPSAEASPSAANAPSRAAPRKQNAAVESGSTSEDQLTAGKRKRVRKRKTGNDRPANQSIDGMLEEAKRKKEQAKQQEESGDGVSAWSAVTLSVCSPA